MQKEKIEYQADFEEKILWEQLPRNIFYRTKLINNPNDKSPIIIDFGSQSLKAGRVNAECPEIVIPSVVFKNKDYKGTTNVGNSIPQNFKELDIFKNNFNSPFEKDLLQHIGIQETIMDYVFYSLDFNNQEIIISESLANSYQNRQLQIELLFECYNVKSIYFYVDSLASYYKYAGKEKYQSQTQLIIKFGHQATQVIPIVKGKIQYNQIKKLNLGGYHIFNHFQQLMHLRYEHLKLFFDHTLLQGLYQNLSYVAKDYKLQCQYFQQGNKIFNHAYLNDIQEENNQYLEQDLVKKADIYSNQDDQTLISPYMVKCPIANEQVTKEEIQKANLKRQQQAQRLKEVLKKKQEDKENQWRQDLKKFEVQIQQVQVENKVEIEKKIEELKVKLKIISKEDANLKKFQLLNVDDSQLTKDQLRMKKVQMALKKSVEAKKEIKLKKQKEKELLQQKIKENPEEHKIYLYQKHNKIVQKLKQLNQLKVESNSRNSRINQKRMQTMANLITENKNQKVDNFGQNDEDWNIYKQVQKDYNNDEEIDNLQTKLQLIELELRELDPNFDKNIFEANKLPFGLTPENDKFYLFTETFRPSEGLFNPNLQSNQQIGLVQIIKEVIQSFDQETQKDLLQGIFLTGGVSQLKGLSQRIQKDLKQYFEQDFSDIIINKDDEPIFNSWKGAKQIFTENSDILNFSITREQYQRFKFEKTESYYFQTQNPFGNQYS